MVIPRRFAGGATLVLLVVLVVAGCSGRKGPERVVVSGRIRYQGQALETGNIQFTPIKGTSGPVSGAVIREGQYRADGRGGVPVGTHRVEITAYRIPPGVDLDKIDPDEYPREPIVPPRYNVNSELEFTVESGQRSVTKDFDLQ